VLLRAAAFLGAHVTGVELDPALAASARALLAAHDVEGDVIEADFDTVAIDADVVFAYLSPATLQRLRPRLARLPAGTRVVTTGYAVPGWDANEAGGRCYLYRLPAMEADVERTKRGWSSAGVLISMHPDAPSLVGVKLHHRGGPVSVSVAGPDLTGWVALRAGAEVAEPGDEVIVDLRFDPRAAGTLAAGRLEAPGEPPLQVFAIVDDGAPGVWGLSVEGCDAIGSALARGDTASVLEDARRSLQS
jgi:hypothetical protein